MAVLIEVWCVPRQAARPRDGGCVIKWWALLSCPHEHVHTDNSRQLAWVRIPELQQATGNKTGKFSRQATCGMRCGSRRHHLMPRLKAGTASSSAGQAATLQGGAAGLLKGSVGAALCLRWMTSQGAPCTQSERCSAVPRPVAACRQRAACCQPAARSRPTAGLCTTTAAIRIV